jgi:hypothetical protein
MIRQLKTSHMQPLMQFITLFVRLYIIRALTLPSTSIIHDLYNNLCPQHQLASPINEQGCFCLIPKTNASHPWPALAGETCCTDVEYMHLHPAVVSLPEEDSAPDLSHTPTTCELFTLFASIHRYIGIVIPFPILDGRCFHAKAEQH